MTIFNSNGTSNGTYYQLTGSGKSTIILIHGLGLNHQMWQYQTPALAGYGQVLCYDLYGHGQSVPPPEKPSLSMFSRQLAELMDALNIKQATIMGFSLGGMIVRRFAMDHPDKAKSIAILHSPHQRTQAAHDHIQNRVYQAQKDGPDATVEDALIRWFTDAFRANDPHTLNQIRQWVKANDKNIYPDIYQVLVSGVDELVAPESPISCPTLVMTGDEDYGNNADMSAAIAAEIPNARLTILKGLRHMAMMEDPDRFNQVLVDFLATHHSI
jgi:pimeloyl-ACP methyl ester carboxylesterase